MLSAAAAATARMMIDADEKKISQTLSLYESDSDSNEEILDKDIIPVGSSTQSAETCDWSAYSDDPLIPMWT